jgi:O-antigen/teichoic acid export membrane protein
MLNLRKLIHGSGLRVAQLVANTGLAFFMMPFLVHSLGDRNYGFWALTGAILGYYGILDFGIVSAVQFYVAKALGEKDLNAANRMVSVSFFSFAALGSFIALITFVVAALANHIVKDPADVGVFRIVLLITGLGFAFGFPGRAFMGAMCAHMRFDLVSQFGLASLVLRTGLIYLAILRGGGLIALAAITISADLLVYIAYYVVLHRIQKPFTLSLSFVSFAALKQILSYSAFTFVVKASDQLRFYVDGFVVGAFVTVTAVTHYSIASRLALTFMDFMIAVLGILAPWFSQLLGSNDHVQIKRVFIFGTKLSAFLATIVGSLLIIYGGPFISAWIGRDYLDAFWPLLLLVSGIYVDVAQLPSVSYLYGVAQHRFLAYATLVEGLINAALSIYLARKYGMIGVAMGTCIPMVLMKLLIQPVYVCRSLKLPLAEYYFAVLGRAVGPCTLGILVPAYFLRNLVSHPNILTIAALVTLQLLIAGLVGYFTVFSRAERETVVSNVSRAYRWRVKDTVPESV